MKTLLLALSLLATTVAAVAFYPEPETVTPRPPVTPADNPPRIEVAFVLDTTGSMGGLINAAKDKIWSIASTLAQGQPAPEIRMGLVAYRDRGDAYVTRVHDLTDDLDGMFVRLMAFEAAGGGDGPEAVNTALHEAVNTMQWSSDDEVYRVIFLVGDAPAHHGRAGEVPYDQTLALAARRGIVVNTILCGHNTLAANQWQQIAQLGFGQALEVGQDGGSIAMTTPYDEALASISRELDDTRLFYGDADQRAAAQRKVEAASELHAAAPTESRARRAVFNSSTAGASNFLGNQELVNDLAKGRVTLDSIEEAELPAALQALPAPERQAAIEKVATRRAELSAQIESLAEQRAAHIRAELEDEETASSLEYQLLETVRAQARDKGIDYDKAEADY